MFFTVIKKCFQETSATPECRLCSDHSATDVYDLSIDVCEYHTRFNNRSICRTYQIQRDAGFHRALDEFDLPAAGISGLGAKAVF